MGLKVKILASQEKLRKSERQAKKKVKQESIVIPPPVATEETQTEVALDAVDNSTPDLDPEQTLPDDIKTEEVPPMEIIKEEEEPFVAIENIKSEIAEEIPMEQVKEEKPTREGTRKSRRVIEKAPEQQPLADRKLSRWEMEKLKKELEKEQEKIEKEEQKIENDKRKQQNAGQYRELEQMMRDMQLLNCKECLIEYETLNELNKHAQTVHNSNACTINCCGKKFRYSSAFGHMRYHKDPSTFTCAVCAMACKSKILLKAHESRFHGLHCTLQCDQCGKKFAQQNHLDKHSIKHVAPEDRTLQYNCNQCDKREYKWLVGLISFIRF